MNKPAKQGYQPEIEGAMHGPPNVASSVMPPVNGKTEAAVRAEREACAKIAERAGTDYQFSSAQAASAAIAYAIRERGNQ